MKKSYFLIASFLILASCGGGSEKSAEAIIADGDLEAITAKRTEIVTKQQELASQVNKLDEAIAKLDTTKKVTLVTTVTAKDTLFKHFLEIQGNVETKQNLVIYPEAGGILTRVFVKEGQRVKKGQLLAKIDDGGLAQQLAQVEVQTQLAKTTFDRQKRLWDQKIGSEIQYLEARTNYESQKNIVDQIKSQLAKTSVTAPFSGVIDNVISEQGSVVSPGQSQLIRIVNLNEMYIEADIPERYLTNITKGKEVTVFFPVLGKEISTKVRQVGNYINPSNRSFKVEIAVPNKDGVIKPNLTAKLKINDYTSEEAILIPQSIISEDGEGKQYAYIAQEENEQNIANTKRAYITTGRTQGDSVEVLTGLKMGDALIVEGARSVKEGQKVQIKKQQ